jgi:RimJ/RimL family protein N-acetyltransferase
MIAETARLRIRRLTVEDAAFVLALTNEPAFLANVGDKGLRSVEDAERFLREGPWTNQPRPGHGQFAVELKETGAPVGVCGLLYRQGLDLSDIGFAVLSRYRGQGLAFEAADAVMRYGRSTLGLTQIVGLTAQSNVASIRLLEKLGLRFERMATMGDERGEVALYS